MLPALLLLLLLLLMEEEAQQGQLQAVVVLAGHLHCIVLYHRAMATCLEEEAC
jgi:hypothetical protein